MNANSRKSSCTMIHFEIMTNGLRSLGEKVYDLRKAGWRSQEAFAKYLEEKFGESLHQTTISAIERGEKDPSIETLALLARALETNTDYLLGLTDDDRPHGQMDDQVVATIEDAEERRMVQETVDLMAQAGKDEKEYIAALVRRLIPKPPRIIGSE
jgi:transcriptional regulator with XRE-family HTH domain